MKIIDINSIPRNPEHQKMDRRKTKVIIHDMRFRLGVLGGIAVLAIVFTWIWFLWYDKKDFDAQKDMFQAVYHFESGDFHKALEGDGTCDGFLTIVKKHPHAKCANLAYFYIGVAYMHQQEYDRAIHFLKGFQAGDFLLAARSWCLIGDAYSAQKKYKQAARYYMKAARYKPNSIYTPGYLIKAAITFEADKRYKDAYDCYQTILERYPKCPHNDIATKEVARLSLLIS